MTNNDAATVHTTPSTLDGLRDEIRRGACVAFVGAGLVMPVVPGWKDLLLKLCAEVADASKRDALKRQIERGTPLELEAAAQILKGELNHDTTHETYRQAMRDALVATNHPAQPEIERRLTALRSTPFRCVVTTNFDELLPGQTASSQAFASVFALPLNPWQQSIDASRVLKLHGQVGGEVVFAREEYRTLVHERGDYRQLLKVLLATHPVLFLGTSFTDAYLNELRSEVLTWFRGAGTHTQGFPGKPRWWALLPDAHDATVDFFRDHEGIEVLSYATTAKGKGHAAFTRFLEDLAKATNANANLAERLLGKRILWIDANPGNNAKGFEELRKRGAKVIGRRTLHEAAAALKKGVDLVITHHGWRNDGSVAEDVLGHRSTNRWRAPVMVFAGGYAADQKRHKLRALGALDYVYAWDDLFRVVADVFETDAMRMKRLGYGGVTGAP